jgi:hypothetical protein
VFAAKIDDLGGRQGNAVPVLARWWHPVSSSKAWIVLHQMMRPALYRRICMAIKTASDSPAFFVVVYFIVGNNHS